MWIFCVVFGFLISSLPLVTPVQRSDTKRTGAFMKIPGFALVGHVISEVSTTSDVECGFRCLQDAACRSYNVKPASLTCQINNSSKSTDKDSFISDPSSVYFDDIGEENIKSCLDYRRLGATVNGIYTVTGSGKNKFKVWCDFRSEPRSAWTLILSFARRNRHLPVYCTSSLANNNERQEHQPNWDDYRLSQHRMQHLATQSTHWRSTTGFPIYGVDYRDYIRARLSVFNIMTFEGGGICKPVEFINIRGYSGNNVDAAFWQKEGVWAFHADSYFSGCPFNAQTGAKPSENDFGFYCESDASMNTVFRGANNDDSTTQFWFGGYE